MTESDVTFRSRVEPPEPMRGLEVPAEVVEALGGGKRPRVTVTLNGHRWSTRIAIMRGRRLIGLSNANRAAAGVTVGERVDVGVRLDAEAVTATEPDDVAEALDADPIARAAFDQMTVSQRRQRLRVIESAKKTDTRVRRIEKLVADLRDPAAGR